MDFDNRAPGGGGSHSASGISADSPGGCCQLDHSKVPDSRTLQSTLRLKHQRIGPLLFGIETHYNILTVHSVSSSVKLTRFEIEGWLELIRTPSVDILHQSDCAWPCCLSSQRLRPNSCQNLNLSMNFQLLSKH